MIRITRTLVSGFIVLFATILALPTSSNAEESPSKVVILGFDGADGKMVEDWMDAGHLPNLDRLRREGTFSDLLPTNPPQTPVSWSTFATGKDPGSTEIFDFLKRNIDTYRPDFAMTKPATETFQFGEKNPLYLGAALAAAVFLLLFIIGSVVTRKPALGFLLGIVVGAGTFVWARGFIEENVPNTRPIAINQRQGTPFWQILSEHGIHSTIIRVPQTFPPDDNPGGRLLAGLGVPDIRGTFGTYSLYTSQLFGAEGEDSQMGGKSMLLEVEPGDLSVETYINGPYNKLFDEPPEITMPLTIQMDWQKKSVELDLQGQRITLRQGEWSDFVRMEFPIRKLVKVHGMARFYLIEMGPHLKLYMSPINLDPINPIIPITYPADFSKDIQASIGDWKTLGWALDTWALNENVTTEETFAEDTDFTITKFEEILDQFIDDPNDRLYCQVFYFTDRAGHMFYRFLDKEHPAYDSDLDAKWGDYILESYKRMDKIVGNVMARLPEDGVLMICSDHGFANWRKSMNMNTWLVRNGYMTLKRDDDNKTMKLDDLFGQGEFWPNVDWERTKAYALGLGGIYINVLGREREGIVTHGEEYNQLCQELKEKLEAYVDPETGEHPVARLYTRDEMYNNFDPDIIPDLRAANNSGYRVSWQTSLGGIPFDMFEANTDKWSGDHCSLDPGLVKGIFFSSQKLALPEQPGIEDMFPTLLTLFNVPIPAGTDGDVLQPR